MQFLTTLASVALALTSVTQASPITRRNEARQEPALSRFYLETQVVSTLNDTGSNKGGLYVASYHTGAGTGMATAFAQPSGSWFYLNDTELLFTYENNEIGPWPVEIEYGAYQAFNAISISIAGGSATPGFSINATGLQSDSSPYGWLACDWWYTAPQIFAWVRDSQVPSSCSQVNLIAIPAA